MSSSVSGCTLPHTVRQLSGIDAGVKVRPTPKELQALGNAFGEEWSYFERAPDKIVIFEAISAGCDNPFFHAGLPTDVRSHRVLLPGGLPEGEYFSTLALTVCGVQTRCPRIDSNPRRILSRAGASIFARPTPPIRLSSFPGFFPSMLLYAWYSFLTCYFAVLPTSLP